jgi:hypothetical protein
MYLYLTENQNIYQRASSTLQMQCNSFYELEIIFPSGTPRLRLAIPIRKSVFGSTYEIIRSLC